MDFVMFGLWGGGEVELLLSTSCFCAMNYFEDYKMVD